MYAHVFEKKNVWKIHKIIKKDLQGIHILGAHFSISGSSLRNDIWREKVTAYYNMNES